jgi:hypothetical protein
MRPIARVARSQTWIGRRAGGILLQDDRRRARRRYFVILPEQTRRVSRYEEPVTEDEQQIENENGYVDAANHAAHASESLADQLDDLNDEARRPPGTGRRPRDGRTSSYRC